MAWTKCKAEGSFFSRASGEGNAGLREGERGDGSRRQSDGVCTHAQQGAAATA
jgi:hypothetical protein